VVQFTAYLGEKPWVWTLHRQTSLPPVSEGRASGAALRAPSPPSGRGVCLLSSSCPGSQTTMTGSELAGHRLLGSARHAVLRTALLARRGGVGAPLKRPPPPGASRSSSAPDGAQTPLLMERRSAPSGGGQSLAIDPAGGIGKYPSGLCMGIRGPLHYRANVEIAVTSRGPAERGEGSRDTGHQMKRG